MKAASRTVPVALSKSVAFSPPTHWRVTPLWYLFESVGGATPSKENDAFWCGEIPWVSPKDMKSPIIRDSEDHISELALAATRLALLPAGSILVVVRGMILVHTIPVAISSRPVTINQDMKALTPRAGITSEFLAYLLRGLSALLFATIEESGHGTRCLRLDLWRNILVGVPTSDEQRAITAFLDRRTAQIDGVIAKKQRMICLLHEKRQALVSEAVTKGLDPDVPTKDSGIEWLGRVPKHWSVERLKWRMRKIEQGWSPQCESRRADPGEWAVLKVGCMNSGRYDESENKALPADLAPLPELEVKVGDVLMSRSNTVELVGCVGRVHQTQGKVLVCDKLYRLVFAADQLDPEYAVLVLRSHSSRLQIERDASGASASMKNISNEVVADLVLAFPSLDEQRTIVATVTDRLGELRRMETLLVEQIAKLREYRQTLISAAVTGQIDVTTEGQR